MWVPQKGREMATADLLDPATTALVVIDVQNDFCHPDGAFGKVGGDLSRMPAMTERLRALIAAARERQVFTVFVRASYDENVTSVALAQNRKRLGLLNGICLEGSWGIEWYEDIAPAGLPHEVVVTKHRFDAFQGTPLDLYLRSNGIRNIVVTGVATSGCVESTVRDAFFLDYYVVVATDAVGDSSKSRHDSSLVVMERAFAKMMPVETIAASWRGANGAARGWTRDAKQAAAAGASERTGLVLVNLQHGREAELAAALPALERLLAAARAGGLPVFHVRSRALDETLSPAALRGPAAGSTADAPFLAAIAPQDGEFVIDKFRASALADTRLAQLLRTNFVDRVVLAGTSALGDVDLTARDALDRDLGVTLAADALGVAAAEQPLADGWRRLAAERGCRLLPVDALTQAWRVSA
ncbi:MAG: cysteine hydrolase [Alphaproteobacteria bacterium]|nr:cysteine hydrolase [Alphaproteobacteria bacterium]